MCMHPQKKGKEPYFSKRCLILLISGVVIILLFLGTSMLFLLRKRNGV